MQSAYEALSFVFEPPTSEQGQPFVIGGVDLNDGSSIVVILAGPERNLIYASVTFVEPVSSPTIPDLDSASHRTRRSTMQILLDAVFPHWDDSGEWLDTNLGRFRMIKSQRPPVKAKRGNNEIMLEVLLNEPKPNFSSAVLTIQTAGKAP